MALKSAKCDPNGIKIAIFFQKLTKNRPAAWCFATAFFNLVIVAILLANPRKSLKFYRFESVQDLLSFINLDFFSFSFVLNLFLLLRLEFFLICFLILSKNELSVLIKLL